MRDFPPTFTTFLREADGEVATHPDTRSPGAFLRWHLGQQPGVIAAATGVGFLWQLPLTLGPWLVGRAVDEGILAGSSSALLRWAGLLGLVTDLLFTARLQEGRLELERTEVDLAQLATQALESARPRAEVAGVNLELDLSDVPPIAGEPVRLAQLLDNLISNAIKFTPADGHVRVGLHARDGLVCLEVSDTGIGISEAERERLFERFFRSQGALERQIQGTGLGLYISKAIVEAHNGRIAVKSTEGKGTTFIVELPASG